MSFRRIGRTAALGGVTALLAVALTACAGGPRTGEGPSKGSGASPGQGSQGAVSQKDLVGGWSSDEAGNPRLQFAEDGTVEGTDGCNGISSTYTIEEGRVLVAKRASTLMACPGVDDWLRAVSEVSVNGDTLVVKNGAGEEIGTLQRDPA